MSAYKNFKHKTSVQIRFCDLDGLNHVNNAVYLSYVELARINYIKETIWIDAEMSKMNFILASATVDFKAPIFYDDEINVYTRCSKIGTKSIIFEHTFVRTKPNNLEEVAMAKSVVVTYDYEAEKSIEIPDDLRKKLEDFED